MECRSITKNETHTIKKPKTEVKTLFIFDNNSLLIITLTETLYQRHKHISR